MANWQLFRAIWNFVSRLMVFLASWIARLMFLALAAISVRLVVLLLDRDDQVDGTAVVGLMALAIVALILAFGGPTLIRRIRRLGPGGVEFERESVQRILNIPGPVNIPDPIRQPLDQGPVGYLELTQEQKWAYEFGTDLILHSQHQNLNPAELSNEDLRRYRKLVLRVGQLAIIEGEYEKALSLLRQLEPLPEKTVDEFLALGDAYRLVYLRQTSRRDHLEQARLYLEEAAKKDPIRPLTHWTIGWVYDELGYYKLAIKADQRAVDIDSNFEPWGYWNMAVSFLKMGDTATALSKLELIPKGRWWEEIYTDPELQELKIGEYADRFVALYREGKDP